MFPRIYDLIRSVFSQYKITNYSDDATTLAKTILGRFLLKVAWQNWLSYAICHLRKYMHFADLLAWKNLCKLYWQNLIIKQFKACQIKPEQIKNTGDQLLDDKMSDLKLVYERFEMQLGQKLDLSKLLEVLASLKLLDDLQNLYTKFQTALTKIFKLTFAFLDHFIYGKYFFQSTYLIYSRFCVKIFTWK